MCHSFTATSDDFGHEGVPAVTVLILSVPRRQEGEKCVPISLSFCADPCASVCVCLCVYVFTHAPVHTALLFCDTVPRSACPGLPGAGMS